MVQVSRRAGFTDSALVRLLARLHDTDVLEPRQATVDRLSEWLGWTDAISLSTVLNGDPHVARASARPAIDREEAECTRVRGVLAKTLAENNVFTSDMVLYRQRYLARQQAMETAIGPLRARLRNQLAARSPAMAKLAAIDAVMEQALGAKEHRLLGSVPGLLEKHFKRLRKAGETAELHDSDADAQPDAWLEVFRKDFQDVLAAELDFRFQPVDGLLEALRTKQTTG